MSDIDPTQKKTVEEWATEAKLLPRMVEETPKPRNREPRLVANREYWKFAAAKHGAGWPDGAELTKAQFDDAVAKWSGHADHPARVVFGVRDVGERADDPEVIKRITAQREKRQAKEAEKAAAEKAAAAKAKDDGKPKAEPANETTAAAPDAAGQR